MATTYHALVLNLHQPAGNLETLLEIKAWEAQEILLAMDRIPRSLWGQDQNGRVHVSFSGTLLETLAHPDFQQRIYGLVKCGELLWHLQKLSSIRVLGTGYYHPVFPLIPPADWEEQIGRWLGLGRHLFWRHEFPGFWPPEMGFCMEMIPVLKRLGFRYVLVDAHHVSPVTPMSWREMVYRPHLAQFGGHEITVVVRDRDLSNAQEAGMDHGWFMSEVHQRTQGCDFPPLVTTCSDGDNGGWFRNVNHQSNFWGLFYQPLLATVRAGQTEIQPTFIEDYLDQHGAHGLVEVRPGAWNTGWHNGVGFTQWTGSQAQKDTLARVATVSQKLHQAVQSVQPGDHQRLTQLEEARWRVLRSETSCHFFWGEAWLDRCHRDLDAALRQL